MIAARLPDDDVGSCHQTDVRERARSADVVVPLMSRIDAETIASGSFRLIQQFGAGVEGVDLQAACARGIWVANAPSTATGNADSIAEHAIMLMLAVLRKLPVAQANLGLRRVGTPLGVALGGLTVCICGLGAIGRALARRLAAFDVKIIAVTRHADPSVAEHIGLSASFTFEDRMRAFAVTDVLVLAMPLTAETRGAIDAKALARLRPDACVVNVARGPLVDYAALCDALASGRLVGAGLDVFSQRRHPGEAGRAPSRQLPRASRLAAATIGFAHVGTSAMSHIAAIFLSTT
jgi:phosphoglycerate dehydrogenase-like enzyme